MLVHGVGDEASTTWRSLAADLSRDYHVVAFDLPGFGRSSKENTLYSPERYIAFIDWLVCRYSSGKIILVGHSLGGALALNYASHYPGKVQHLVVVDAAGILHRIALAKNFLYVNAANPEDQDLFGAIVSGILNRPRMMLNHLSGSTVENLESKNSETGLELINAYDRSRDLFLGGDASKIAGLALVQEDFTEIIAAIKVPTSLIWGRDDEIAPLRTGQLLAGQMSRSRLRIMEQVGHVPMLENAPQFQQILREELAAPPAMTAVLADAGALQKLGVCKGQRDVVFRGNYERIEISNCQGVLLKGVRAGQIVISNSQVEMEDTTVRSNETALVLSRARVTATNLLLAGEIAIQSSESRLDVAGGELHGKTAALQSSDKTLVLFSVSRVSSPHTNSTLHGVVRIGPDNPL